MLTIVSPQTHSQDEHAIVALLSDKTVQQATTIQAQLVQIFGDIIWLQQPPALHITLMEIICDTEYRGLTRQQYFAEWYEKYNRVAAAVIADFSPVDVVFNELLVSQRAIILKAANPKPLNNIRQELLSKTVLPEGTKLPPDIVHCSLARFAKEIDLEEAIRQAREIRVDCVEHIKEFALVRDLGPPNFNGTPMQKYPLNPRPSAGLS